MTHSGSDRFVEELQGKLQAVSLSETHAPRTTSRTSSEQQQAVSKEAEAEEAKCRADLAAFALYLTIESGETIGHPWLAQMLNVVMLDMDPRELLEVYLRKPDSLTLRDCKNPKRYWKPSLRGRPGIAKKISKAKALRVLVGNKAWMDNPELQRLFKGDYGPSFFAGQTTMWRHLAVAHVFDGEEKAMPWGELFLQWFALLVKELLR